MYKEDFTTLLDSGESYGVVGIDEISILVTCIIIKYENFSVYDNMLYYVSVEMKETDCS